jgi:hypothetical protein
MPTSGDILSHNDEHRPLTPVLENFFPSFCSDFPRTAAMVSMAALLFVPVSKLSAQTPAEIMTKPEVQSALQAIKTNEPHFIEEQIRICEIAAPSFQEEKRGEELSRLFRETGLKNVHIDHAGNVLGDRQGSEPHPHLVIAAHLDTVFPPETDVHVTREGNLLIGSIKALNLGEPGFSSSSSDSNVPMHLGIPAITIGGGGMDKWSHSLNETDDVTDSYKGVENALLIVLSILQ